MVYTFNENLYILNFLSFQFLRQSFYRTSLDTYFYIFFVHYFLIIQKQVLKTILQISSNGTTREL